MTQNQPYALIFEEPEYINAPENNPEDNQRRPVDVKRKLYVQDGNLEAIDVITNRDGTIQLIFESLPDLYYLIINDNHEIDSLSRRLKESGYKNNVRPLKYEIIDKLFSRTFQVCLKRHSALPVVHFYVKRSLGLSVVHSLFKSQFSSPAEFYHRFLSVYMLNTHLLELLNGFLKGGSFNPEDDFLPIFLCICHAFLYKPLNQVDDVNNFYQEIKVDESNYCVGKKIQLKEFWIMKNGKPDFRGQLGKDARIYSEGFYYKLMEPAIIECSFDHTKSLKTYLHIEVPERIARDYNYSIYIKTVQEKAKFRKGGNQAIFAPGCNFIVGGLTEIPAKKIETGCSQEKTKNEQEKIRIIKLKVVTQGENEKKSRKDETVRPLEAQETGFAESKPSFWNAQNYVYWDMNADLKEDY